MVVLLFLGYASYYFCRSDLSVALPMLREELKRSGMSGDLAMVRLGSMASLGVVAYAFGKLFLSGLGDLWGGRRSFLGGLGGALLCTLLFTLGGTLPLFTFAWIANRLVQSMGWAGIVKICSRWFSFKSYGTIIGILSLSFLIGDAAAREWMGWLISEGYGWRSLFYLAAVVSALVLLANLLWLKESRTDLGFPPPESNPLNLFANKQATSGVKALLTPLFKNRAFWIVCFLSLCTTIVRETFNTWTPTYLHSFFGYSESAAAKMSAVFPALGALSVVISGLAGDRLGINGRAIILFIGMILTAGALCLMATLHSGEQNALPLCLIGVVGLGLLGPYSYLAWRDGPRFWWKAGRCDFIGFSRWCRIPWWNFGGR